jgi:hypothetical protein
MKFCLPVELTFNNRHIHAVMGPFENSAEREFSLTVNKRAIDDCTDLKQLKEVSKNLLQGWCSMQTAVQSLMLENIQLRQAMAQRDNDLVAAEEMLNEAAEFVQQYAQQSTRARRRLWPW